MRCDKQSACHFQYDCHQVLLTNNFLLKVVPDVPSIAAAFRFSTFLCLTSSFLPSILFCSSLTCSNVPLMGTMLSSLKGRLQTLHACSVICRGI